MILKAAFNNINRWTPRTAILAAKTDVWDILKLSERS